MNLRLPQPPSLTGSLGAYLARLNQAISQALQGVPNTAEAAPFVLLRSPNGTNYKVTVSDSGTLTTGPL